MDVDKVQQLLVGAALDGVWVAVADVVHGRAVRNTDGLANPSPDMLWRMPLIIVGIFVVRGLAGYMSDVFMARSARSIARDLRVRVFGKFLRMPGLHFDSEPVSNMVTTKICPHLTWKAAPLRDSTGAQKDTSPVAPAMMCKANNVLNRTTTALPRRRLERADGARLSSRQARRATAAGESGG